jgi:two-component system, OmpR family, response regulator
MNSKTILIADDDNDYLFQLRFYLQKSGYRVISAESEREALLIMETEKPDLAIFDLMMENEDSGFKLSYRLKQKYPSVPIIIATAVSSETGINFGIHSEEDRQWIKADSYLEKGIRNDQMLAEVKKLLKE